MKRGRPFEAGNTFGRGRPRGSRNKKSLLAQQLLEEHSEALMRKAMVEALKGNARLLQVLVGCILPRPKELPVKTGLLRMGTSQEMIESFDSILKKAAAGQITLQQAQGFAALIDARRQLLVTQEFETRLLALEQLNHKETESR
jgi:hypothetical protein